MVGVAKLSVPVVRSAHEILGGNVGRLYTKNGKPLQLRGDHVFDRSGRHVGCMRGKEVFGPNGRYVGTVVGDRVIYRSTESAGRSSTFARRSCAGTAAADRARSALWGEEPRFD